MNNKPAGKFGGVIQKFNINTKNLKKFKKQFKKNHKNCWNIQKKLNHKFKYIEKKIEKT